MKLFVILSLVIGISIGLFYLMSKKEKAQLWNKKTKVLLISAVITLIVMFTTAAFMSNISVKLF